MGCWRAGLFFVFWLGFAAGSVAQPAFLPGYFAPAFTIDGSALRQTGMEEKDGITRVFYASADGALKLTVDHRGCDPARCAQMFENGVSFLNATASRRRGRFRLVTEIDLISEWREGAVREENFVFRLPGAVTAWILVDARPQSGGADLYDGILRGLIDRLRAEQLAIGPADEIAAWARPMSVYARRLLARGDRVAARILLRRLAEATTLEPAARMDLAEAEDNLEAARAAARIVLETTEDSSLAEGAARLLGISLPGIDGLPVLRPGARGLQLVLVPLPPCDIRLLADAAGMFERITDIPVSIARLATAWTFLVPDRFFGQPEVEQDILKRRRVKKIDFSGWDRARFAEELRTVAAYEDAGTRYLYTAGADAVADRPRQYRAKPYLEDFFRLLAGVRGDDSRVMYVGVTEANFYEDSKNFVFSQIREGKEPAGLLSYAMMLARTVEEPGESRARLIERLAKEMVFVALSEIGIPPAEDLTDPHSSANSIERLDARTLTLSAPTRAAIAAIRGRPP